MKNGLFVATIFIVCCIFLLMLLPDDNESVDSPNADSPKLASKQQGGDVLPVEPVKKGLRHLGDKHAANDEKLPEMIARLPAVEPPPEPEEPKPEIEPRPGLVVEIPRPTITAANRLQGAGYKVTLSGIATVEPGKQCGESNASWHCGNMARTALRRFVRGRTLNCIMGAGAEAKTVPATCSIRGRDLARWLVSQGWAVTTGTEMSGFQKRAKLKERGLWANGNDALASVSRE